ITEYEEKIKEQNSRKEQITIQHKSFFAKREELVHRMNALDKEIFRLNSQMEKLDEQLDQLIGYMWEEYELTVSTAFEYPIDEEISLPQIKKSIVDMKGKI